MKHNPEPPAPASVLQTIATFPNPHEAYLARAALASHGIDAVVHQDHVPYSSAGAWVFVQVAPSDSEMGRRILESGPLVETHAQDAETTTAATTKDDDEMRRARLRRRLTLARWYLYGNAIWLVFALPVAALFVSPVATSFFPLQVLAFLVASAVPLTFVGLALWSRDDPRRAFGTAFALQSGILVVAVATEGPWGLAQGFAVLVFYFAWMAATPRPPDELKDSLIRPAATPVEIGEAWQQPVVEPADPSLAASRGFVYRRVTRVLLGAAVGAVALLGIWWGLESPRVQRLIHGSMELTLVGHSDSAVQFELQRGRARLGHALRAAGVGFDTIDAAANDTIEVAGVTAGATPALEAAARRSLPGWSFETTAGGDFRMRLEAAEREAVVNRALDETIEQLQRDFGATVSGIERAPDGTVALQTSTPGRQLGDALLASFAESVRLELHEVLYPREGYDPRGWPPTSREHALALFGGALPPGVEVIVEHAGPVQRFWPVDTVPIVVGTDLVGARAERGPFGDSVLVFQLSEEAGDRLAAASERMIGRAMAVVLRGDGEPQVVSAPTIQGQIRDRGQIAGRFTDEEAQALARRLVAGSRPIRLRRQI